MTSVLGIPGRAGALAQQLVLAALPHGLQARSRRNAMQAVAADDGRRRDRLAAAGSVRAGPPGRTPPYDVAASG